MSTETPTRYFIKAKCWASQSKKESSALECLVEAAATTYLMSIAYAHCSCTAGVAGSCHHLVALLLSIEHCAKKQQDVPAEQTCTTEKQAWGPRPRQVVAQPVSSLVIEKADPSKNMDDIQSVRRASSLYEARGPSTKEIKCEALERLLDEITATGRRYPIATLLSRGEEVHQCQSKVGAVPFGSVLCYHQLEGDKVDVPPARKRPFVAIADQPQ
eukprot:scpid99213/ scgid35227/ 